MGWITRVPSPMNAEMAMHQSISCHDRMITSYVDCAIQNHYNRFAIIISDNNIVRFVLIVVR